MQNTSESTDILLTVSLLVSNSKDTIKRTLASIEPLLTQLKSELIVVDTGSTDGSIDIVREYTEKIVQFHYCGDISAARNAGLSLARGQWFLFLDDDEWFVDVREILLFFRSGEYKKYKHARYCKRSYTNGEGGFFIDESFEGACNLNTEISFTGTEYAKLTPLQLPAKQWKCLVCHDGYLCRTPEEEKAYHESYISYLTKAVKKKPDDLENAAKLAEEYANISDYTKGIEVCRFAIQTYKWKWNTKESNWLMYGLIRMLVDSLDMQKAWEEGWQILSNCKPNPLTKAHICIFLIKAAQDLTGHEEERMELAIMYRQNIEYLRGKASDLQATEVMAMTYLEAIKYQNIMTCVGITACLRLEEFENLGTFLIYLPWEDRKETPRILEEYKKAFPKALSNLILAMSQIKKDTAYLSLQRLLAGILEGSLELQDLFNHCLEQCYMEKVYFTEVLTVGMSENLNFIELFAILDLDDWEAWVYGASSQFSTSDYLRLAQIVERCLSTKNHIQYTAFLLIVQKHMMLQESVANDADFLFDLEQFCSNVEQYFLLTYQEAMFRPENQLNLPRICRFALRMNRAFESRKARDFKSAILGLREAIIENPELRDVVEGAILLLEEELLEDEKRLGRERLRNDEFLILANQIKLRVSQLIAELNKPEALLLVAQLETLLPYDDEVKKLRSQAEGMS